MTLRILAAFAVAGILATAAQAQEVVPAPSPAPDTAPASAQAVQPLPDVVTGKVLAAKPGKGQVVFFRESKFMGGGITWKVRENGVELGTLSSGHYFIVDADPGVHNYSATTEATDTITLEVEDGETYFVETAVAMGALIYRPNIRPSTREVFVAKLTGMKPAKPLKVKN